MCSRYSRSEDDMELKIGDVTYVVKGGPQFVIRPTNPGRVVMADGEGYVTHTMRWGFSAPWTTSPLFNARAETAASKPTFRGAYRERRCLVPACGFYESEEVEGRKLPVRFIRRDHRGMWFAGLWAPDEAGS